jgi:hypothetical protein
MNPSVLIAICGAGMIAVAVYMITAHRQGRLFADPRLRPLYLTATIGGIAIGAFALIGSIVLLAMGE